MTEKNIEYILEERMIRVMKGMGSLDNALGKLRTSPSLTEEQGEVLDPN